jgi:hypothetical protein
MPLRAVTCVAISPDGQKVTRLSPIPKPVSGSVERIVQWIQVLTGMEWTRTAPWERWTRAIGRSGGSR